LVVIKASLFLKLPELTAAALAIMADSVNDSGDFTVLCIGRSVFINDVKALATFGNKVKYIVISKEYFGKIFHHFFDRYDLKTLTEKTYHNPGFCLEGKREYNAYLFHLLPVLKRLLGFDAMLSGNFGYQEQQEIEEVSTQQNIPFIILHKEGLITPGSEAGWAGIYSFYKFRGAKALFYNRRMKDIYCGLSSSGVTEKNSKIVGMPRLDFYFPMAKSKPTRKQVLFFSFYSDDKMQWLAKENESQVRQIRQRSDDFHKWVVKFAANHPDIPVIIKTKMSSHYIQYVQGIINDNFKQAISNLTVINVGEIIDLINNASVVIGFNSTTCLKAIVTNRLLISPYLGDIFSDKSWDYFGEFPELVNYAKTEADLTKLIMNSASGPVSDSQGEKRKVDFLNDMVFNSDGQASRRAELEIINTIQEYKNKEHEIN